MKTDEIASEREILELEDRLHRRLSDEMEAEMEMGILEGIPPARC